MNNEKVISPKNESPLRRYFRFRPVVVEREPEAQRIEFHVGNQTFQFGPEYCESVEHAEWFIDMGIKALHHAFRGMCNKCSGHGYIVAGDWESGPTTETCDDCGGKGKLSTDESALETSDDSQRLRKIIGDIHEITGEDRNSDDDTLPDRIRCLLTELRRSVQETSVPPPCAHCEAPELHQEAAEKAAENALQLFCAHGVAINNPNDWLGWTFCEDCPDCIAQKASGSCALVGCTVEGPHQHEIVGPGKVTE